jgi:uncharacterized protein (DUF697 family)
MTVEGQPYPPSVSGTNLNPMNPDPVNPASVNPASDQPAFSRGRRRLYESLDSEPEPLVRPVVPAATGLHSSRRKEALQLIDAYRQRAIRQGMFPLPGIDLALVARLQSQMLRDLADRYGVRLTEPGEPGMLEHMIKGYGLFSAGGSLLGSAVKWIPVLGSVAGMTSVGAAAGSSTKAMGLAFLDYVEQVPEGADLSVEDLRVIFEHPDEDSPRDSSKDSIPV